MHSNYNSFRKEQTINALLYIIEQMGGKVDMHKAFKTLYFADRAHLSKYGRSITGDDYIAMKYGPVPSQADDMLKAVRGSSYFSNSAQAKELLKYFSFVDGYVFKANCACDKDYLSESDLECLNEAIAITKDKSFRQLVNLSHSLAWNSTDENCQISVADILRENGESEDYVKYITEKQQLERLFCV